MSNTVEVKLDNNEYLVHIETGAIDTLYKYLNVQRQAYIITDSNVKDLYAERVAAQFVNSTIYTIGAGEASKSYIELIAVLNHMQESNLNRDTVVIGLGGGVVGDIAGLVAALYLRGLDYVAIPTTTLAQVDSSVGGKVAINLNGIKNVVGTFYQPETVVIDPTTLDTLSEANYYGGLMEAVKIALLFDEDLFDLIINSDIKSNINEIITRAINLKAKIVKLDEKDKGVRNLLNLGHTLGHALESKYNFSHGQSILLGMIYTIENQEIKNQLIDLAKKLDLKFEVELTEDLYEWMIKDKKVKDDNITIVHVDKIGEGYLKDHHTTYLWKLLNGK